MRIDSDPRNLVTGGERFPVDLSLPQVPADELGLDPSILVHEDVVDFDHTTPTGMPPLFGRDEIEPMAAVAYEPGLDGPAAWPVGLAPASLDFDALDATPDIRARGAGGVQPFTVATGETDAVVGRNAFAPFLDPFSFIRGDALEPRLRPEELRALAQIGRDDLQTNEPDWDTRVPLVGRDEVVFASTPPVTTSHRNARDGIDLPRARMLRI